MLDDEKQPISQAVTDFPDPPYAMPATASPVPSGASSCANDPRKTGIVLIDELPLRSISTLNLLRRHFREATQLFAGTAEFLMHAPAYTDVPSTALICIGGHSMADPPLPEHLHLIGRAFPTLRVIVLSDREEPEEVVMALRHGVQGYVPTSLAPRLVIGAIRIVLAGGTFYPADMMVRAYRLIGAEVAQAPRPKQVMQETAEKITDEHQGQWPPRQLEVLCLLAQGKANRQIAASLAIEEGTVKVHLRDIMRKFGVVNRTQAALAARRLGIPAIKDTLAEITAGSNTAATRLDGPRRASWLNRSANVDLIACPAE